MPRNPLRPAHLRLIKRINDAVNEKDDVLARKFNTQLRKTGVSLQSVTQELTEDAKALLHYNR